MKTSTQLALARGISSFGDSLRFMIVILAVMRVNNSPATVAFSESVERAGELSALFVLPLFIDLISKFKTLFWADFLSFLASAAFIFGMHSGSLPILLSLGFFFYFMSVVHSTALEAVTADLEGESGLQLVKGFSNLQLSLLSFSLLGSLFFIAFSKTMSLDYLIVIDALSFLIASTWIKKISQNMTSIEAGTLSVKNSQGILEGYKEGLSIILRHRAVRWLVLTQAFLGIAHGLFSAASIGHVSSYFFRTNEFAVNSLSFNYKIGSIVGAILRTFSNYSSKVSLIFGTVAISAGYLGMGFTNSLYLFFVFHFLQQAGAVIQSTSNRALVFEAIPQELRGRVSTFRYLAVTVGMFVGATSSIILIQKIGTQEVFIVSAGIVVICLLLSAGTSLNETSTKIDIERA